MIEISEHSLDESFLAHKKLKILDLGACLGEFSSGIKKFFDIEVAVLVEANPTNFKKINQSDNFIILNEAVFHKDDEEYILFNEDVQSPYNGSIIFNHFQASIIVHKIKTTTLKKLISLFHLNDGEYIDILKIDIEGGEYELLLNSSKEELSKFKQITIEFHDFINPELRKLNDIVISKIQSFGFELKSCKPASFGHGSNHYDTLFINKN